MRMQREQEASGSRRRKGNKNSLSLKHKEWPGGRRQQRNPSNRKQKKIPDWLKSPLSWMQSFLESLKVIN
jgi:hypothetical protein